MEKTSATLSASGPWKYSKVTLIGLLLALPILLCLTRWYAPPLALSRTFDARFEWDSVRGFRSFTVEDNSLGDRGGRVWQFLVAAQIKPRLASYLTQGHLKNVKGSALIKVAKFVPVALPESWGMDGLSGKGLNQTPLMRAAEKGDGDTVKSLIAAGAEVNVKDYWGRTPLLFAFDGERTSIVVIRELLAAGADVNAHDRDGYTALLLAVLSAPEKDRLAIIRELLAAHVDVNAKNNAGQTPLMAARAMGDAQVVKVLLAAGAGP